MMGEVELRDFQSFEDYVACVDLQREIWAFPEVDLVPSAHLSALHRYGGVFIGAFDSSGPGRMVGFVCGFTGRLEGETFHHSHMLGVLPAFRGQRLGERLKWAQATRVAAKGLTLINWTFDPLQALNANLNINRLGVVIDKYIVNLYGESVSPLHGGIPTDRFEADWWIESDRVQRLRDGGQMESSEWERLPRVNECEGDGPHLRCRNDLALALEEKEALVEIPADITSIMRTDRPLAVDWRLKTREIFQRYFGRGYAIVGFHRSGNRQFYRLRRSRV